MKVVLSYFLDIYFFKMDETVYRCYRPECVSLNVELVGDKARVLHLNQHLLPFKCSEDQCSGHPGFATAWERSRHCAVVHRSIRQAGLVKRIFCVNRDCPFARGRGVGFTDRVEYEKHRRRCVNRTQQRLRQGSLEFLKVVKKTNGKMSAKALGKLPSK